MWDPPPGFADDDDHSHHRRHHNQDGDDDDIELDDGIGSRVDALSLLLSSSSSKRLLDISDQPPAVENKNDNDGNTTATKMTESRTGRKSGMVGWRTGMTTVGITTIMQRQERLSGINQGGVGWSMTMVTILGGTMRHPPEEGRGDGSTDIIQTPLADAMDDERSNAAADGGCGCVFALTGRTTAGMITVMAIVKVLPLVSNYTNSKSMGEDILCLFYRF
jgi:hypothetical protein